MNAETVMLMIIGALLLIMALSMVLIGRNTSRISESIATIEGKI